MADEKDGAAGMTQLTILRRKLTSLRRSRATVRLARVLALVLTAVAISLLVLFWLDVQCLFSLENRVLALCLVGVLFSSMWQKMIAPDVLTRETDADVALLVQRKLNMSSDMIAALQFESPLADGWGSSQLRQRVVQQVARETESLVRLADNPWSAFRRHGLTLAIVTVIVLGVFWLFPEHGRVFLQRIVLSPIHYPTRTKIESIALNEHLVLSTGNSPHGIAVPEGREIEITIRASGTLPDQGLVRLARQAGRSAFGRDIALRLQSTTAGIATYAGNLGRILDPIQYDIRLGDACTDPSQVHVVAAPVIEVDFAVTAPSYTEARPPGKNQNQLAVMEGSRVGMRVRSVNQKRLVRVSVEAQVNGESSQYSLLDQLGDGREWMLPTGTPWENVRHDIDYEIQVSDVDGLELLSPLRGKIRLQPDQPPLLSLQCVHRVVLPAARPTLELRASDDYGIASLTLHLDIHSNHNDHTSVAVQRVFPILAEQLPMSLNEVIDLGRYKLAKGDRITLTLEGTDFRGDLPRASSTSEPITIEVSDEQGVLAAVSAADEKTERELNDIIRQQLGIGESR